MLEGEVGALQAELRTREARGEGTDVRLVLIEVATVAGCLVELDNWLAAHAHIRTPDGPPHLALAAARGNDDGFERLDDVWSALDLEEVTMRMREAHDLLGLLMHGGAS